MDVTTQPRRRPTGVCRHRYVTAVSRTKRCVAALVVAAVGLTGCGAGDPPPPAHQLDVVATTFALAQLVSAVGTNRVNVTDLAAGAPDDRSLLPSPAQRRTLSDAALVVDVGGGYQPHVEAAAGRGDHVVSVLDRLGPQRSPDFWLDPSAMERATTVVSAALQAADPGGRTTYRNGAEDFTAVLSTLNIDYQNTLSDCQHKLVIVPDRAFAAVVADNLLQLDVLSPSAGTAPVARAVTSVQAGSLTTLYSEPPVISAAIAAVAARTHTRVLALDTLDGLPPANEPAHDSYFNRMEGDLARFSSGLQCQNTSDGP